MLVNGIFSQICFPQKENNLPFVLHISVLSLLSTYKYVDLPISKDNFDGHDINITRATLYYVRDL